MTVEPRGDRQWGEILQLPNLRSQFDLAAAARDRWMARNGEMTGAQNIAMSELSAALKAGRDAKMAELLEQNKGKGGGGSGRSGGGGGGGAAPLSLSPLMAAEPWDYSPVTSPAPALNLKLQPSTMFGPNEVYRPKVALPGQKGYIPPRPKPVVKKPSKYKARLS